MAHVIFADGPASNMLNYAIEQSKVMRQLTLILQKLNLKKDAKLEDKTCLITFDEYISEWSYKTDKK